MLRSSVKEKKKKKTFPRENVIRKFKRESISKPSQEVIRSMCTLLVWDLVHKWRLGERVKDQIKLKIIFIREQTASNGVSTRNPLGKRDFAKTRNAKFMVAGVGDRSYRTGSDTEGAATTDNPTTPFPTPPPTLTPNHRQASPFPLESTNSRRHHYNGSISSERSRNGNGAELIRAASGLRSLCCADAPAFRNQDSTYLQMPRDESRVTLRCQSSCSIWLMHGKR